MQFFLGMGVVRRNKKRLFKILCEMLFYIFVIKYLFSNVFRYSEYMALSDGIVNELESMWRELRWPDCLRKATEHLLGYSVSGPRVELGALHNGKPEFYQFPSVWP
jgi:hypothetical protein